MGRYFDVHPVNPQPRLLNQTAEAIRDGGLVAIPTDSGYALCGAMGAKEPLERIKRLRNLDDKHHFTLMVSSFAQLGEYVDMDRWVFRTLKGNTPGRYTFIVKASREVPKLMQHPKKRTVGVRVPEHVVPLSLLEVLGAPLLTSTLILPGETEPMTDGWTVQDELGSLLDVVLDCGECGHEPTTVVDLTGAEPEVLRVGAGNPAPFELS
ncbi:L-threonylcarbamoyladenylate synthase [Aestuariimicrobium kwangyangense]|uniref:L-threonylcarbamoyladenylate synthase n=1 Tax=Aestuariimicrobium kwangyangense TaxID=396389 RepID=UPI0003B68B8A|nr:L-threonylcarbamoyladenylate synthase [Aestuariimicrobium kwangyangense]